MLTLSAVVQRLKRAAALLHQLPAVPESALETWPIAIQKLYNGYLRHQPKNPALSSATPHDLLELHEVFEWLNDLSEEDQRLVWLRAEGFGWVTLKQWFDQSRFCLQSRYKKCLAAIKRKANQSKRLGPSPVCSAQQDSVIDSPSVL